MKIKLIVAGAGVNLNNIRHTVEALKKLEGHPVSCAAVDIDNYVPIIPMPNPEDLLLKPSQKELSDDHSFKAVKKRNKFFK
jgi:hypothetical protein